MYTFLDLFGTDSMPEFYEKVRDGCAAGLTSEITRHLETRQGIDSRSDSLKRVIECLSFLTEMTHPYATVEAKHDLSHQPSGLTTEKGPIQAQLEFTDDHILRCVTLTVTPEFKDGNGYLVAYAVCDYLPIIINPHVNGYFENYFVRDGQMIFRLSFLSDSNNN